MSSENKEITINSISNNDDYYEMYDIQLKNDYAWDLTIAASLIHEIDYIEQAE